MTLTEVKDVVCVLCSELVFCKCHLHEVVHVAVILHEGVVLQFSHWAEGLLPPFISTWVINKVTSPGYWLVVIWSPCMAQPVLHLHGQLIIVATCFHELLNL